MAKRTESVTAELEVTDRGTAKRTKKQIDRLTESSKKLDRQSNKTNRNLRGTAQSSGSAGKDFSRQAQGMGGLVAAYATVAANVFALSTAFNVLKRSADFDSMVISANNLTAATGASFINMAERVKQATGNQIQFEDALKATNKAVASGIDTANLEKFTDLATKAAQTFGGTTTDALNRMIDAVLRGRTELVNKMGIVISADEAYKTYGASIGKAANELTSFEKRQAITNTIIEEGNKSLGQTVIDPNPFQVLAVTFQDLSQDLLSFATSTTGIFTNVINLFNESKLAVGAFASIIVSSILKRAIPTTEALEKAQEKALAAQQAQAAKVKQFMTDSIEARKRSERSYTDTVRKESQKRLDILQEEAFDRLADKGPPAKAPKTFIKFSEGEDLDNKQRAALIRSVKSTIGTSDAVSQAKFGMSQAQLKEFLRLLQQVSTTAKSTRNGVQRFSDQVGVALTNSINRANLATQQFRLNMSGLATQFTAARLQATDLSFRQLFTTPLQQAGEEALTFGGKVGAVSGRVVGGFTKIISAAGWIGATVGILATAWEYLGPIIRNTNKEQENFNEKLNEADSSFKEYIKTIEEARDSFKRFREQGVAGTASELNFLSNLISESIQGPASTIEKELNRLTSLQNKIANLVTKGITEDSIKVRDKIVMEGKDPGSAVIKNQLEGTNKEGKNLIRTIDSLSDKFKQLAKVNFSEGISSSLSNLVNGFESLQSVSDNLFNKEAFNKSLKEAFTPFKEQIKATVKDSEVAKKELETAFEIGIETGSFTIFNEVLKENFDLTGESGDAIKALFKAIRLEGNRLKAGAEGITTINKTLDEMDARIKEFNKGYGLPAFAKESISELIALKDNFETAKGAIEKGFEVDKNKNKIEELTKKIKEAYNITDDKPLEKQLEGFIKKLKDLKSTPFLTSQIKEAKTLNSVLQTTLKFTTFENEESRIEVIKQIAEAKKTELKSQLGINTIAISAIDAELAISNLQEERTNELKAQRRELLYQNAILGQKLVLESESALTAKEASDVRKRALEDELKLQDHNLRILQARNKLKLDSSVMQNMLKVLDREQKYNAETLRIRTELENIEADLLDKNLKLDASKIRQLELRKQDLIYAQQLAKEEERIARANEKRASKENSRRAMSLGKTELAFGNSLTTVLKENANKLDDSMNILVNSFNTGINNVFQQLIKGEVSFKESVAALGDTVFDALTTTLSNKLTDMFMTNLFGDILGESHQKKLERQNDEMIELLEAIAGKKTAPGDEKKSDGLLDTLSTGPISEIKPSSATTAGFVENNIQVFEETGTDDSTSDRTMLDTIGDAFGSLETTFQDISGSLPLDILGAVASGNKAAVAETIINTAATAVNSATTTAATTANTANNLSLQGAIYSLIASLAALPAQIAAAVSTSSAASSGGGLLSSLAGSGANGGVMSGTGVSPVPLANGGIATKAQLYEIGEGRKNEAVVPLPNNREIPVVMQGDSGGDTYVNNYDFSGADPATEARIRNMIEANGAKTFNKVFHEMDRGGMYSKKAGRRR